MKRYAVIDTNVLVSAMLKWTSVPGKIQAVMGHANIKITMDIYTEISEEKKRSDINKLAANWNWI